MNTVALHAEQAGGERDPLRVVAGAGRDHTAGPLLGSVSREMRM